MRVLGLALYGHLAASTRYRLQQYTDGLATNGIQLEIRYLLDDEYLRSRFASRPPSVLNIAKAAVARLTDLRDQRAFDAIMLYSELLPLVPGWIERSLLTRPYVYDFDDAFYLKYRMGRLKFARPVLGNKFDWVLRSAGAVTAGNHVLAEYARQHNGNTVVLPTVVDTRRYCVDRSRRDTSTFTIGWIGSPSTAPFLKDVVDPLTRIGRDGPTRLIVIGGPAPRVPGVQVIERQWREDEEIASINEFDVGIMPLPDDPWARGKCAFKLVQYMACGVPTVASPVGANRDVVTEATGFLAANADDWVSALRSLRDDADLRRRLGTAGRERIESQYSLESTTPVLAHALRRVANAC